MSETEKSEFEYRELLWGDLIYGSKSELEELGIAVGLRFPGEQGGPKRSLSVFDPRGFKTRIRWADYRSQFCASISFPGRERPSKKWESVFSGVTVCRDCPWLDEYLGTSNALVAAGLVNSEQFPGQPGMRKLRVKIFADGTLPAGAATINHRDRYHEAGAKTITKATKNLYRIDRVVSKEEKEHRDHVMQIQNKEWEAEMLALPRPAPLRLKSTTRQLMLEVAEYRNDVKNVAEHCFRMLETYMFDPDEPQRAKEQGLTYAPEVRDALLDHHHSIWQELRRLIEDGKLIKKSPDGKPMLSLVKNPNSNI